MKIKSFSCFMLITTISSIPSAAETPFLEPVRSLTCESPRYYRGYLLTGDFNNDGIPDVASYCNNQYVLILVGNGDGTFVPFGAIPHSLPYLDGQPFAVGDLNDDGWDDVVTSRGEVYLNLKNGTFEMRAFLSRALDQAVAIGDMDLDGNQDVAVSDGSHAFVYWGNGDGTFSSMGSVAITTFSRQMEIADYDNDGVPDLFKSAGNLHLDSYFVPGSINRQLSIRRTFWILGEITEFAAGDFNGDGYRDIIYRYAAGGTAGIRVGLGRGFGFDPGASYPYAANIGFIAADVTNDGILDLVGTGFFNVGNGDGTFGSAISFAPRGASQVADFNGDGYIDTVIAEYDSSSLLVYLNSGKAL